LKRQDRESLTSQSTIESAIFLICSICADLAAGTLAPLRHTRVKCTKFLNIFPAESLMKILAVSDNVLTQMEDSSYLRRTYSDVEMLVSCGDLPAPYLEFITSTLNTPLLFVRGNHDTNYAPEHPGGEDLHQRLVQLGGLTFAGLEGSPRYNREPVQYSESQMFFMVLSMAPRMLLRRWRKGHGVDVMVTHAPPRGIHDLSDRAHRGFTSMRMLIQLYRPRYLLHGHVDTWDRRRPTTTNFAGTEVININPLKVLTLERRSPSNGP
jgi:calcineurin-like phosphoesterase family protein